LELCSVLYVFFFDEIHLSIELNRHILPGLFLGTISLVFTVTIHQVNLFSISQLEKVKDDCPVKSLEILFFTARTVDNLFLILNETLRFKD